MTTANVVLFGTVLVAAGVEILESAVIVLAVNRTHGARVALSGAGSAVVILAALIAIGGVPAIHLVPITALRLIFGLVMLWMGRKWVWKNAKRYAGRIAKRDEEANYSAAVASLSTKERREGFMLAWRQTMIEGLEVCILVVAFGGASHSLMLPSVAALTAVAIIATASVLVAPALRRVDEALMKLTGGVTMLAMGAFWIGESAGLAWPGQDASILGLIAIVGAATYGAIRLLRQPQEVTA